MLQIQILFCIIGAIGCGVVANNKNRNVVGWAIFGFFLPLIALIWIACLKRQINWSNNPEMLDLPCPHCQSMISYSSKFCPKCGESI